MATVTGVGDDQAEESVRSLSDEQVLNEFGKAMLAHSYGYYDFTDRMEALRAEALRRMR